MARKFSIATLTFAMMEIADSRDNLLRMVDAYRDKAILPNGKISNSRAAQSSLTTAIHLQAEVTRLNSALSRLYNLIPYTISPTMQERATLLVLAKGQAGNVSDILGYLAEFPNNEDRARTIFWTAYRARYGSSDPNPPQSGGDKPCPQCGKYDCPGNH